MLGYLVAGLAFGLAAGLSPGPLLALLAGQTLRYGAREGILVSLAPIVSDLPIITLSVWALSRFTEGGRFLEAIAIAGGVYMGWLGIGLLRTRGVGARCADGAHSMRKAVTVNCLNPHVYIFWFAVGSPLLLEAYRTSYSWAAAFLAGFYVCLCGSKIVIALLIHRWRRGLSGTAYVWLVRALGLVLVAFGGWVIWDGGR